MHTIMEEKTCDLVVLGGGGSGLAAAVRAAQKSGKKVILVEKTSRLGGGASFATFMRTFDSRWQRERGIECQTEDYIRYVQDDMYWRVEPELAWNAVKGTGEFFDWLLELDPSLEDQFTPGKYLFPNPYDPVGPQAFGDVPRTLGRIVTDTLTAACRTYGVEVLLNHRAYDVELENGRLSAVIVSTETGNLRISCKACVLATGSWIRNEKITEKVCPNFDLRVIDNTPHTNPAYTGDGIPIAEHAGAFVDWESFCFRFMGPMTLMRSPIVRTMMQIPFTINVNLNGKRYCSEPMNHMKEFRDGVVQMQQPYGLCFHIFDTNAIEAASKLPRVEIDENMRKVMGDPNVPEDVEGAKRLVEEAFADTSRKNLYRADTLEELAMKMGVDYEAFLETIARYNENCALGVDRDFLKPSSGLLPISKPPYYGVRVAAATDGAFGGVLVDGKMRAYNADKTGTVEGLYVTGDFASGRFVNIGGFKEQLLNDLAWAFSSGYLAGTNSADYICEE